VKKINKADIEIDDLVLVIENPVNSPPIQIYLENNRNNY